MQNLYQDKHDPLCPERGPAEEEGGYNHNWKSEILLNTTGGGPRLDHRARLQFGRVPFGVFSTSRFVPSALSSNFFTTMYFSSTLLRFSLTFHLLFRTFDVLLGWILLREYLFLENNIPDLGFLGLSNAIYMKLP